MLLKHFQSQGIIFGLKQMQLLVLKGRMSGWIYLCLKGNKTPGTLAEALNLEASLGQWQLTSVTTLSFSAQQVRTALRDPLEVPDGT